MVQINQYLADPVWWFNAVIVAILAGVVGAYLKDLIDWVLRRVSANYRHWQEKEKERQQGLIEAYARNETLLLMANAVLNRFLIVFIGLAVLFVGVSLLIFSDSVPDAPKTFLKYFAIYFGLVETYYGYHVARESAFIRKVNKRYCELHVINELKKYA